MPVKTKKEMMDVDVYALVGASPAADIEVVRKAYKRQALKLHPDKNRDRPDAADRFSELQRAYELLCDEKWKEEFDRKVRARQAQQERLAQQNIETQKLRAVLEEREALNRQTSMQRNTMDDEEKARYQTNLYLNEFENNRGKQQQQQQHKKQKTASAATPQPEGAVSITWTKLRNESAVRNDLERLGSTIGVVEKLVIDVNEQKALLIMNSPSTAAQVVTRGNGRSDYVLSLLSSTSTAAAVAAAQVPDVSYAELVQMEAELQKLLKKPSSSSSSSMDTTSD